MLSYKVLRIGLRSYFKNSEHILHRKFNINLVPLTLNKAIARYTHDGINNKTDNEIVYVGPLSKQIRSVKLFTLITSVTGVFAQPVIYEKAVELNMSTGLLIGMLSAVGFFTFLTPLLLHFVTKKYVMEVTYDVRKDLYAATIITLFLRKRVVSFKPGEPVVPDVLGMFTSMTVRGIPLFIDVRFFNDVNHYQRIMGYDKPIDLKLSEKPASESH